MTKIIKAGVIGGYAHVEGGIHIGNKIYKSSECHFPAPLQRPFRAKHFTGREKELEKLIHDIKPCKIITLCGAGGIGKSALVSEAVWHLAPGNIPPDQFPNGIIFFDFYTDSQADKALEHIALSLGEDIRPTPYLAARRAIAGKKILLLLDGAENSDNLQIVLSIAADCGVIVTTRNRNDAAEEFQTVSPLTINESIKLLQSWIGKKEGKNILTQICHILGGLPLAVRLVGRYIKNTEEKASDYLDWIKNEPLMALDQGRHRHDSIPILLEKSIKQLSKNSELILHIAGLLAFCPFNEDLVAATIRLPTAIIKRSLGELIVFGFILRHKRLNKFEISHALIHTYISKKHYNLVDYIKRILNYYTKFISAHLDYTDQCFSQLDPEKPHLIKLLYLCKKLSDYSLIVEYVLSLNQYLEFRNFHQDRILALELGINAYNQLNDRLGQTEMMIELASACYDAGCVARSIEVSHKALPIIRMTNNKRLEGRALGWLGFYYAHVGNLDNAIKFYYKAIRINRKTKALRLFATNLNHLGIAYHQQGFLKKALRAYEKAISITRQLNSPIGEAADLGNIAKAHHDLGFYFNAIFEYEEALMIQRRINDKRGEGLHLDDIGNVYRDLKDYKKAVECYIRGIEIGNEISNPHVIVGNICDLAKAYLYQGDHDKALETCEKALKIAEDISDRRYQCIALGNLGNVYHDKGFYEKAIVHYKQALVLSRDICHRFEEARNLGNIGSAYGSLGELEVAKKHLKASLSIYNKIKSEVNIKRIEGWLDNLSNS